MDSHSSRFLQSAGYPVQGSLVGNKPITDCGRGNSYSCLGKPNPGHKKPETCGPYKRWGAKMLWDLEPWMHKVKQELNCFY
ncbi:hypothetical protein V6N11_051293 [Hibiscus sabdariffa]|uniref:Uncharacterized protein n=1 Tax=Hibiscus sabdariffa TaxID=183260 RepID=A0ABR2ADS5_9ROSI